MKKTILIVILLTGLLLTACGSQATEAPASQPTEEPAPAATEAPTDIPPPTDTAVPVPTDTVVPTEEPATAEVTYSSVQVILNSRCITCHGGDRGTEEGLDMNTYASLMAGSDNGPVIVAGDADASLLVELIVKNEMPKRGPKLTPPQIQLIIDWINQGALEN